MAKLSNLGGKGVAGLNVLQSDGHAQRVTRARYPNCQPEIESW